MIRNMNNTHIILDKSKEPGTNKNKWKYGDIIKAASANVRGMRDPTYQKSGDHYTNEEERNIYIYIYI